MQQLFGRGIPSMSNVPFWDKPEREGWLMKQGALLYSIACVSHAVQESTLKHGVDVGLFSSRDKSSGLKPTL